MGTSKRFTVSKLNSERYRSRKGRRGFSVLEMHRSSRAELTIRRRIALASSLGWKAWNWKDFQWGTSKRAWKNETGASRTQRKRNCMPLV